MIFKIFSTVALIFFINQAFGANENITDICHTHNCKMIIDAGSSGSRIHLYSFDKDENNNLTNVKELLVNKVNPGLSEIELQQVPTYFSKLMQGIPTIDLTIHLYATAGMRMLPEDRQHNLYTSVFNWFKKQKNWHLTEARTISGAEEGVFGWFAMYNALGENTADLPGFIEIGGASTQVVFPISIYSGVNPDDIVTLNLNGNRISLFSHSFLGFGANEITKKFINTGSCFPLGYKLNNGDISNGDASLCQQEVMDNLNSDYYISNIVKLPLQNNLVSTWYTVGAISTIAHKEPLNISDSEFSSAELLEKVNSTYCRQDWYLQQQSYSANDIYLNQNCLISSFFYGLTTTGYGLDPEQKFKTFAQGVGDDWTIGALQLNVDTEHRNYWVRFF